MKVLFFFFFIVVVVGSSFVEEPSDVSSVLGSTILFRCKTDPLLDVDVSWCKNDFCTLGKSRDLPFYPRYEIIGREDLGEHHFRIVNLSREDLGVYQCQIVAGTRRAGQRSRKAKLTLLEIPSDLSFVDPFVLIDNVPSSIVCRCSNGIPEPRLKWILPEHIELIWKNDYLLIEDESHRQSISNITLLAQRSSHNTSLQCQSLSPALDLLNRTLNIEQRIIIHCKQSSLSRPHLHLRVLDPPELELRVKGEMIEGKWIEIECQIDCRPSWTNLQWSQREWNNRTTISFRLTRQFHLRNIFCQVENPIGRTNRSIQLQVQCNLFLLS